MAGAWHEPPSPAYHAVWPRRARNHRTPRAFPAQSIAKAESRNCISTIPSRFWFTPPSRSARVASGFNSFGAKPSTKTANPTAPNIAFIAATDVANTIARTVHAPAWSIAPADEDNASSGDFEGPRSWMIRASIGKAVMEIHAPMNKVA